MSFSNPACDIVLARKSTQNNEQKKKQDTSIFSQKFIWQYSPPVAKNDVNEIKERF